MKNIYFIAFLMLLSITMNGQYTVMFNDTIMPFGNGRLDNIVETDSFYFIGGIHAGNNTNQKKQFFLLKYNKNGVLLKKKMYLDFSFSYGLYPYNSMIFSRNKIFTVFQVVDTTGYVKSKILVINKNSLDTIWTKTYNHPDTVLLNPNKDRFIVFTAIKETIDYKYILVGNYMSNGNLRSFLMKIDSVGNVEWRRAYNSYYTFFDIEVAADSGYFVPCTFNGNSLVLIKLSKDGIYEWKKMVNSNTNPSYPISVSLLGNNSAIVASSYWYDPSNYLRAVTVAKVNITTKSIIWEKTYFPYKNFACVSLHQAMGVETLSDGSIIISGTSSRYGHDAVILKLNSNGDSLWCKSYDFEPDPYDCQLNDLIVCDDGGFMGVGFWSDQSGPGWTAWMFKTDANGVIGWDTSTPLSGQKVKVYPNPARDFTNIEFGNKLNNEAKIEVYNSLGQMVLQDKITKGEQTYRLELKGLSSGIYFFEVFDDKVVLGGGKFVVE